MCAHTNTNGWANLLWKFKDDMRGYVEAHPIEPNGQTCLSKVERSYIQGPLWLLLWLLIAHSHKLPLKRPFPKAKFFQGLLL